MKTCIFVSYSSKDRALASKIHERLDRAGFFVWRDTIRLETDWSREIALALTESADAVCLLWSENAAASRWVKHEWLTARALEKQIIPCLLSSGPDLPLPINNLHGIHLDDVEVGCKALIERLTTAKSFRVPYQFNILPGNSFVPFNPNPEFIGRNADLVELYLRMIGNLHQIGINQVGTTGMGGVGKTQLAVEFAYRYSFAFDNVFWLDATRPREWLRKFIWLARDQLHLKIPDSEGPEGVRQYLFELQRHFKQHPNTLLVMDNVEDPKLLNSEKAFLGAGITPLSLGANLLFTTRRSFDLPGVLSLAIDVLPPDRAYDLLTIHRKPQSEVETQSAQSIVNAVGYLPLAIVLIAGYLKKFKSVSFATYLQALRQDKLTNIDLGLLSEEELATRHKAAVGATLETQWQALKQKDAKQILTVAGVFPESAIIPKARLGLLANVPASKSVLHCPLEQGFLALEDLSLVESMGDSSEVRLHPLVREFARSRVPKDSLEAFLRNASKAVASAYRNPQRLEAELGLRGVEEVITDLRTAMSFYEAPGLSDLERLLSRGRHQLSSTLVRAPEQLLQQFHYHAACMGLAELADRFLSTYRASLPGWTIQVTAVKPLEDSAVIKVLRGHSHKVVGAAFVDNQRALSASWDGSLILWDLASGEPLRRLRGHSMTINALTVTPDGRLAASASDDKTVIVWDLTSGESIRRLYGHKDYVLSVAMSSNGRHVVSTGRDRRLVYWDFERVTEMKKSFDNAVAIRSDGGLILCAPGGLQQGEMLLVDPKSLGMKSVRADSRWITAIAFASEGNTALTAGTDNKLILWDTASCIPLLAIDAGGEVNNVMLARDGMHAISNCDNNIVYWDLENGKVRRTFRGHGEAPNCLALSPNGKLAISSASWEHTLTLWDVTAPELRESSAVHPVGVVALAYDKSGTRLVSLDEDGHVLVWDADRGEATASYKLSGVLHPNAVNYEARLVLSSTFKEVYLQNFETGDLLHEFRLENTLPTFGISSDGRFGFFSVSGADYRRVGVLDLKSGINRTPLSYRGWVHFLSPTADGKRLLIASDFGRMILWDLGQDRELKQIAGPEVEISSICVDATGHLAATATWEGNELAVWDINGGSALCKLRASRKVTAIAIHGMQLVFADEAGRLHFVQISN